jgi:GNAT superfamily N-acetyltransferase
MESVRIVPAQPGDVPVILQMIAGLAEYEQLSHELVATEDDLQTWLFGERPVAEVILAYAGEAPIGFALFFHNFSTFVGRPGLYLEDLFVVPAWRGRGVGKRLLGHVASIAAKRRCGRMEWTVLDWNESAIGFYQRLGATVLNDWRICRLTGEALRRAASTGA